MNEILSVKSVTYLVSTTYMHEACSLLVMLSLSVYMNEVIRGSVWYPHPSILHNYWLPSGSEISHTVVKDPTQ